MEETVEQKKVKIKITLLGDQGVGKSTICTQLTKNYFQDMYKPTIGCEFHNKSIDLPNNISAHISIWDVGSQSMEGKMFNTYIFGSDAIIFVYDITNMESFKKVQNIIKQVAEILQSKPIIYCLIGNKSDQFIQQVIKTQDHTQGFLTSAKTVDQILNVFKQIAADFCGISMKQDEQPIVMQQAAPRQEQNNTDSDSDLPPGFIKKSNNQNPLEIEEKKESSYCNIY